MERQLINYSCNSHIIELFWTHVDIKSRNQCWNWKGSKDKDGYGKFSIPIEPNKRKHIRAHRFSYFINSGEIPNGLFVCHSCDNPSCVNPKHLWVGSARDNIMDAISKNRIAQIPKEKCAHKGESNYNSKIEKEDVLEIRRLYSNVSIPTSFIAKKFNIQERTVRKIAQGKSWKHIEGTSKSRKRNNREIDYNVAMEIRKVFNDNKYKKKELADLYNIDASTVSRIISNKVWKIKKE